MQKVRQSLGEHLPPVKIYKEEVEDIYTILNEVSNEVSIEADGFIFENINELFTHKKSRINSLKMSITKPSFLIEFEPRRIWIFASDNTSVQVGLYEQIKSIVKKHKNWSFWLITNPVIAGLWTGFGSYPLILFFKTHETEYLIASFLIYSIAVFWWLYEDKIRSKRYSQILLIAREKDKTSFVKRNIDSIIIALITVIASGIVSYILK
jgi:hypothetical protein